MQPNHKQKGFFLVLKPNGTLQQQQYAAAPFQQVASAGHAPSQYQLPPQYQLQLLQYQQQPPQFQLQPHFLL